MDLALTEQQQMLKSAAQTFVREKANRQVLQDLDQTATGISPELWKEIARMGWLGLMIPEQYGGDGGTLLDAAMIFEALGSGPLGGPHFTSAILGAFVILEVGSEEQRREILPRVVQGEHVLALAMTEPDYGWEPESVQLRARRLKEGYSLNGVKLFVRDAMAATHLLVVARTDTASDPSSGITVFLIDRHTPGVAVRNLSGFMGPTAEVKLENVQVPTSAALGKPGSAWSPLQQAILRAIPVLCAYKVGGCQAVFDMTVSYSQTRIAFGQPIGRFQRVQDHVIEIVNNLDAARLATYEAIWKLETGRPAETSVHLAKAVASEAYHQACNSSHEVHAALGALKEYGLTLHTQSSRGLYHYLGDPTFHKQRLAEGLKL